MLTYIKKKKNIFYVIIIILFIGSIFYGTIEDWVIEKNGIYTIGIIKNVRKGRGGYKADIYYYYKGKKYKGYAISSKFEYEDKRFYIQFIKECPNFLYMVREEVPGYIEDAPYEGWKRIP